MINATITFTDFTAPIEAVELESVVSESWAMDLVGTAEEFADMARVDVADYVTSVGVWKGQVEPSITLYVQARTRRGIQDVAAALAARYDQEAVMVTELNSLLDTTGVEISIDVDQFETATVLEVMALEGVTGGRIEDGRLVIYSDDPHQLSSAVTLSNRWSLDHAAAARAEFVPADDMALV